MKDFIYAYINEISALGTIVGILGLIISLVSLFKISSVKKELQIRNLEKAFYNNTKKYFTALDIHVKALRGERSSKVITSIIETLDSIYNFSDNKILKDKERKKILQIKQDFLDYDKEKSTENDDVYVESLIRKLNEIKTMLEKQKAVCDK